MPKTYDFSLFAEKKEPAAPVKKANVTDATIALKHSKNKAKKHSGKIKVYMALISVLLVASFAAIINSNTRLNEYADKIAKETREIAELEAEHTRLQMELEAKMSTRAAEEYARDVLGMQKIEPSQIERIEGIQKNETETTEESAKGLLDLFN